MKIGILETGLLNEKLQDQYEPYPVMFATLLDRAEKDLSYQSYSVIRGEMPDSVKDCDGWLITGSRHAVYENLPWMLDLQDFIRGIDAARVPLVGICFGHQIVAQALGGEVVESDKGWGIGVQSYQIDVVQPWMPRAAKEVRIYAFHQDQVVRLPPQAQVYLSSAFCPYAGLSYGDSIITMQAHPEFEEEYEVTLLELYGGNIVPEAEAEAALDWMRSTGQKADTQMLAEWIAEFFQRSGQT
ncbi:MAG: type 1 glutamine amidotransferase [Gammaproteobacteria bacterium]|nr:type 1 glutamine amidotransferase [Gammaproteobacteria bacterium]